MKNLGQRYVQYINRVYQRRGTLWEGRFRSSFVERSDYFLKCHRHIELNPVRAGMVKHPRDYPWSSYGANVEMRGSSIIQPRDEYLALGAAREVRCAAYRHHFRFELGADDLKEIRCAAAGGYASGNARFQAEIAAMTGRRASRGCARAALSFLRGQSLNEKLDGWDFEVLEQQSFSVRGLSPRFLHAA